MQIDRIDPADDDAVRACHAVHVAEVATDDPGGEPPDSLPTFRAWLAPGWQGEPSEAWYVPADGAFGPAGQCAAVAGWYRIQFPDLENRDRAFMTLAVHPGLRRRGLGRALVAHAQRRAAAEGRTVIDSQAFRGRPATPSPGDSARSQESWTRAASSTCARYPPRGSLS